MLQTEWFDEECETELRKEKALRTYQKNKTSSNWLFYHKKRQSISSLKNFKATENSRYFFETFETEKNGCNFINSITGKQIIFSTVTVLQNSFKTY